MSDTTNTNKSVNNIFCIIFTILFNVCGLASTCVYFIDSNKTNKYAFFGIIICVPISMILDILCCFKLYKYLRAPKIANSDLFEFLNENHPIN